MLDLLQQSIEIGMITSLVVLALYLSYTMLNVCDLSTDGAYIFGAAVGAVVAISGHPFLAILAAMGAGMASGLVTAFLQTKLGVNSLLAGIVVNTGLYSVNIAVMGAAQLNMNKTTTIFSMMKDLLRGTFLESYSKLIVIVIVVALVSVLLTLFLKTRLGLALRATGNNPDMVRSSSINTTVITIVGLMLANALTGLAGCLFGEYNKSLDINSGVGTLTIALASLLIGRLFFRKKGVGFGAFGAIIGAILFRIVYAIALKLNMPTSLLKLVSSVIVVLAIAIPYLVGKAKSDVVRKKRSKLRREGGAN